MVIKSPISPSGVAMWRVCPFKFLLHYSGVRPLPVHPSRREPLDFGRYIHEVIKDYYSNLPPSVTPASVRTLLSVSFKRVWPEELMHLRERAERQLLNFMRFEERRIAWGIDPRPIAVEREYRRGIIHGVVDAVFRAPNGELVVVDWKTGQGRSRLTDDIVFQMNAYLYLTGASRAYVILLEWGEWYEVRPSMDVEVVARELVSSESFPRRRGPHCRECEYQIPCLTELRGIDTMLTFWPWREVS